MTVNLEFQKKPAIMFLIAIFVMPETRKHSIWEEGAIEAVRARGSA